MKLSQLLERADVPAAALPADPEISGISEDSRTVRGSTLFFARKGAKSSGFAHLKDAIQRGATAVIAEENVSDLPRNIPLIVVPSMSAAQPRIASVFYGHPSKEIAVVGVTGTNGKTTFTYLLESILSVARWKTGVVGTVSYRLPSQNGSGTETLPAPNTTPNALELQKILYSMKERSADAAVMEISSHALALNRVGGIEFDGAVFTNLTQDHLDFHGTMENYFAAKAKLFASVRGAAKTGLKSGRNIPKFCVINRDDEYGAAMAAACGTPPVTYGIDGPCDYQAANVKLDASGTEFDLRFEGKTLRIRSVLVGKHNVQNILAAFAAARKLGISTDAIQAGLSNLSSVPGRLDSVKCGQDFTVLVDYAHTEDALKNVLNTLQAIKKRRILTLFGCGGDRDRSKRPAMGACAVTLSDHVVLTSDNPRSEDPEKIALDIEVGIHRTKMTNYEVILDRAEAIRKILGLAQKDDIVLIAGKGHENYQIFKDRTIHFDDREIAADILCGR